ncbi:MAG: epoxyqueuosine reductase QueH [Clostridia bacterium]|nr:epoxyqueuosine reductase QueH [Clostridia bacterium]
MNKVNYKLVLEKTLREIKESGSRPKLLLHACCAPCSSYVLEYLAEYFDITVFFYNPNIFPEQEYRHRVEELKRLVSEMCPQVNILEGRYDPQEFFDMAKGLENEPERGERCHKCYRLRLNEAAAAARKGNFDYFTTTLSISPLKDSAVLNAIGREISEKTGIPYLFSDFKKNGGYKRSIELSAQYCLYRQDYCGCVYSKAAKNRS